MDSFENPGEILPVEDVTEVFETDVSETLGQESQEREEIMDLIFPEDRVISVSIYTYISRLTGKAEISAVMSLPASEFVEAGLEELEIRSSWSIPTAAQMDEYRQECSEYQPQSQSFMTNNLAIRDVIVAHHLKELLLPPKYKPFPFKYVRPDQLSGSTVKHLKSMHSAIYDRLYTKFISESCLIV